MLLHRNGASIIHDHHKVWSAVLGNQGLQGALQEANVSDGSGIDRNDNSHSLGAARVLVDEFDGTAAIHSKVCCRQAA